MTENQKAKEIDAIHDMVLKRRPVPQILFQLQQSLRLPLIELLNYDHCTNNDILRKKLEFKYDIVVEGSNYKWEKGRLDYGTYFCSNHTELSKRAKKILETTENIPHYLLRKAAIFNLIDITSHHKNDVEFTWKLITQGMNSKPWNDESIIRDVDELFHQLYNCIAYISKIFGQIYKIYKIKKLADDWSGSFGPEISPSFMTCNDYDPQVQNLQFIFTKAAGTIILRNMSEYHPKSHFKKKSQKSFWKSVAMDIQHLFKSKSVDGDFFVSFLFFYRYIGLPVMEKLDNENFNSIEFGQNYEKSPTLLEYWKDVSHGFKTYIDMRYDKDGNSKVHPVESLDLKEDEKKLQQYLSRKDNQKPTKKKRQTENTLLPSCGDETCIDDNDEDDLEGGEQWNTADDNDYANYSSQGNIDDGQQSAQSPEQEPEELYSDSFSETNEETDEKMGYDDMLNKCTTYAQQIYAHHEKMHTSNSSIASDEDAMLGVTKKLLSSVGKLKLAKSIGDKDERMKFINELVYPYRHLDFLNGGQLMWATLLHSMERHSPAFEFQKGSNDCNHWYRSFYEAISYFSGRDTRALLIDNGGCEVKRKENISTLFDASEGQQASVQNASQQASVQNARNSFNVWDIKFPSGIFRMQFRETKQKAHNTSTSSVVIKHHTNAPIIYFSHNILSNGNDLLSMGSIIKHHFNVEYEPNKGQQETVGMSQEPPGYFVVIFDIYGFHSSVDSFPLKNKSIFTFLTVHSTADHGMNMFSGVFPFPIHFVMVIIHHS